MSIKFSERSRARIAVFQILFQEDLNPGYISQFSKKFLEDELPARKEVLDFAQKLLDNTQVHRENIDETIQNISRNWDIARMSTTDRNVLRLGVCEMLYLKTPKPVVIKEALEIASQFGTKNSTAFVNGILDKVIAQKKDDPGSRPEAFDRSSIDHR